LLASGSLFTTRGEMSIIFELISTALFLGGIKVLVAMLIIIEFIN
jgi:hypothetical protein